MCSDKNTHSSAIWKLWRMVKTKTPSLNEIMKRAKNEQSIQFVKVKVTKLVTIVAIIL